MLPCQEGQQEAHQLGEVFLGRAAPVISQHTQPEDGIALHFGVCLPGSAQQDGEQVGHKLI